MAQLSDDCFAFGGPLMSIDEAVGIIASRVTPVADLETVPVVHADGRVIAADLRAPLPLPPFTNSAVDGYAVRSADLPLAGQQPFPVTGRIQAGAAEVHGNGAEGLDCVGVHRNTGAVGQGDDLGNGLDGADFVVGPHHGDQRDRFRVA